MALSRLQEDVARIILAAANGRLSLAGGAAMIALGMIERETDDLDAFGKLSVAEYGAILGRVKDALSRAGYNVMEVGRAGPTYRRLSVSRTPSGRSVEVDVAADHIHWSPAQSYVGQTVSRAELAANKIIAAYYRNEPRDIDDIAKLIPEFGIERMLTDADAKSPSPIDRELFADNVRMTLRLNAAPSRWPDPASAVSVITYIGRVLDALSAGLPIPSDGNPYAASSARTDSVRRCGHWLPRANRRCELRLGHAGQHR